MMEKPKWSYWSIAVMGLIWSLMGCLNFIMQTDADFVAKLPDRYHDLVMQRPAWATASFAVAVFGGAVGCILLLLRRAVAVQVLGLALVGALATFVYGVMALGLASEAILSTGVSVIVAAILFWLSVASRTRGWLR
ncbi:MULTISPECIES: hypothetical protein [Rhodobacterales]|uniref:hypothetical protein n=1 Tax=Rhodobacterales TaxID=204455 RepID=UPI00215D6516|nr:MULTISPECIES: hypothetical protein [Rhodobacterales]